VSIILIVGSQSQISLQTLYCKELYDYIPFNIAEHQIFAMVRFDPLVAAVLHPIDRLQMNDGDRLDLLVVDRLDIH
jgi:hypothetical protein